MIVVDPIVLSQRVEPGNAEVVLAVPRDLDYFQGHFPGAPVVPGVVQVKWALALGRRLLGIDGDFAGIEALKFQHILGPGVEVSLELKYAPQSDKLHFAFRSGERRFSSGRVLLRAAS